MSRLNTYEFLDIGERLSIGILAFLLLLDIFELVRGRDEHLSHYQDADSSPLDFFHAAGKKYLYYHSNFQVLYSQENRILPYRKILRKLKLGMTYVFHLSTKEITNREQCGKSYVLRMCRNSFWPTGDTPDCIASINRCFSSILFFARLLSCGENKVSLI